MLERRTTLIVALLAVLALSAGCLATGPNINDSSPEATVTEYAIAYMAGDVDVKQQLLANDSHVHPSNVSQNVTVERIERINSSQYDDITGTELAALSDDRALVNMVLNDTDTNRERAHTFQLTETETGNWRIDTYRVTQLNAS